MKKKTMKTRRLWEVEVRRGFDTTTTYTTRYVLSDNIRSAGAAVLAVEKRENIFGTQKDLVVVAVSLVDGACLVD